jgi:MFS family permease
LLFWGRASDLYSARPVFIYGFLAFAVINLILSFLTDQYSFLVLRAFAGVAGSALVPSAYRLIASNFPEEERGRAYTLYGMTGSIANALGVIIAGVIGAIEGTGQMRNWRWFFRIVAALS